MSSFRRRMMMSSQTQSLILTQDDCQIEGAITASTGEVAGLNSYHNWYHSDYIEVYKYKKANITTEDPGATAGIALYDKNYNYLWGFPYSQIRNIIDYINFPEDKDYYYIRITAGKNNSYKTTVTLIR